MLRGGKVTLIVADVGRSARFYIETLGLKLVDEREEASVIDAGDDFLIELRRGTPAPSTTTLTLFAKVPLAEAIAIYENRGVVFASEATAGGRVVARFVDPDANVLFLA